MHSLYLYVIIITNMEEMRNTDTTVLNWTTSTDKITWGILTIHDGEVVAISKDGKTKLVNQNKNYHGRKTNTPTNTYRDA